MSDIKAFPSVIQYFPNDLNADEEKGMTLRDYFAAKAMQAQLARTTWGCEDDRRDMAIEAYQYADAMLEAREAK